MTAPVKLNFSVYQGSTFKQLLRWESATVGYANIVGITKGAPVQITAPAHGIPNNWRVKVNSVNGMKEINTGEVYYTATVKSANLIEINSINSNSYTTYTSGGVVEYNKPVDLNDITARFRIVETLGSTEIVYEATTQNGGIIIDTEDYTITIVIPASVTSDFTFLKAVYELSILRGIEVVPFATGIIYVERGVVV